MAREDLLWPSARPSTPPTDSAPAAALPVSPDSLVAGLPAVLGAGRPLPVIDGAGRFAASFPEAPSRA